jgi:hypothetical protein
MTASEFVTSMAKWQKDAAEPFEEFAKALGAKFAPPPAVAAAEEKPEPKPAPAPETKPEPAPAPKPAPAPAAVAQSKPEKPKLLFLGVRPTLGVTAQEADTIGNFVQSQLADLGRYEVVARADIETLLGVERQKQLLGCSEEAASCMEELAGALNADRVVVGDYAKVHDDYVINLSLLDPAKAAAIGRVSRSNSDSGRLLEDTVIALYELANQDPVNAEKPLKPERGFGGFMLGVRGDADVLGLGVAPSITAEFSGRYFGGALTVIAKALPGVRLEGRFYPFRAGRFRPYIAAGGTGFTTGVSVRGALGLTVRFGQIHVFADAAYERYLYSQVGYSQNAVVIGAGVGWLF